METKYIFGEQLFHREHDDLAKVGGAKVETLTEAGLAQYFINRLREFPELLKNTELIIDYPDFIRTNPTEELDLKIVSKERSPSPISVIYSNNMSTPKTLLSKVYCNFSDETARKIAEKVSENLESDLERRMFIIHRDGHTVLLVKEGGTPNKFFLVDSYNAYGAKDKDHLPLLKIIRENCPKSTQIYTLHDKIQSDYCSCRIFAVESAIEIERFLSQDDSLRLGDLFVTNSKTYFDSTKDDKSAYYLALGVETKAIPLPLIPFIQSYSVINSILTTQKTLLQQTRQGEQTYQDFLEQNTETFTDPKAKEPTTKLRNNTITNISREAKTKLAFFLRIVSNEQYSELESETPQKEDNVIARSFVSKLLALEEIRSNSSKDATR